MRLLHFSVRYRVGQRKAHHPHRSTTSNYVPTSYQQLPEQPAAAAREYILTNPETQMQVSQTIQPANQSQVVSRGQQQPRGPQTSHAVVDEQQPGTSRQLHFIKFWYTRISVCIKYWLYARHWSWVQILHFLSAKHNDNQNIKLNKKQASFCRNSL